MTGFQKKVEFFFPDKLDSASHITFKLGLDRTADLTPHVVSTPKFIGCIKKQYCWKQTII